jgi:DNA-binding NarL/FixJ family response regulator
VRSTLTPREEEVLRLLTLGQCNKEIAAAMRITLRTVKYHMTNLLLKFGVTSRLELLTLLTRSVALPLPPEEGVRTTTD